VTEKIRQDLQNVLEDKLIKETSFDVIEKTTNDKDVHTIQYRIYGLDFKKVIEKSGMALIKKVTTDKALIGNIKKIDQLILDTIQKDIQGVKKANDPVYSEIEISSEKGQYFVKDGQENLMKDIYYQFLTGANSEKDFQEGMTKAFDAAKTKARSELEKDEKEEK
jgi:hypothetical protein